MRKIFMKRRDILNSKDYLSHESIGQASVAYSKNSIGKHLERSRAITVSSEAALPTLLYMALNAR